MLTFENISLSLAVLTAFGALVFLFAADRTGASRFLGVLLVLVAIMYSLRFALLKAHPAAPYLAMCGGVAAWFHGPCLEQYVRASYFAEIASVWRAFLPAAIVGGIFLVIYVALYLSFEWARKAEAMVAVDSPFHDLMTSMLMGTVVFTLYYLWRLYQMARDYHRRYESYHAGELTRGLWEIYAVLALAVCWLSVPVVTEAMLFWEVYRGHNFLAPTSALAVLPLLYLAFRRAVSSPERLPDLQGEQASAARSRLDGIAGGVNRPGAARLGEIAAKLREALEEDRIYLNEDLSLMDLALELDESRHQISEAIGAEFQTNFYGLINRYRVAEARQLLRDSRAMNESILDIAYRAGFRSKAVFNRSFKAETGQTPGEYRNAAL
ncbi:MAG: AraC family transcriptional regulator [bacterium]|nr:AraC family transcriptional regulator [bacterium]